MTRNKTHTSQGPKPSATNHPTYHPSNIKVALTPKAPHRLSSASTTSSNAQWSWVDVARGFLVPKAPPGPPPAVSGSPLSPPANAQAQPQKTQPPHPLLPPPPQQPQHPPPPPQQPPHQEQPSKAQPLQQPPQPLLPPPQLPEQQPQQPPHQEQQKASCSSRAAVMNPQQSWAEVAKSFTAAVSGSRQKTRAHVPVQLKLPPKQPLQPTARPQLQKLQTQAKPQQVLQPQQPLLKAQPPQSLQSKAMHPPALTSAQAQPQTTQPATQSKTKQKPQKLQTLPKPQQQLLLLPQQQQLLLVPLQLKAQLPLQPQSEAQPLQQPQQPLQPLRPQQSPRQQQETISSSPPAVTNPQRSWADVAKRDTGSKAPAVSAVSGSPQKIQLRIPTQLKVLPKQPQQQKLQTQAKRQQPLQPPPPQEPLAPMQLKVQEPQQPKPQVPIQPQTQPLLTKSEAAEALKKYFAGLDANLDARMSQALASSLKIHGVKGGSSLSSDEVVVDEYVVVLGSFVFPKAEYMSRCVAPVPPIDKREQLHYVLEGFRLTPVGRWADAYGNFPFKKDYTGDTAHAIAYAKTLSSSSPSLRAKLTSL